MLNYETEWMTRDEIVAATYEALRGMARLKYERGQVPAEAVAAALDAIATLAVAAVPEGLAATVTAFIGRAGAYSRRNRACASRSRLRSPCWSTRRW